MQKISDAIQTAFDGQTTANIRRPVFKLFVSWLRVVTSNSFGVVGTSTVNNCLVRGNVGVVTPVDLFEFIDESDKVISLEYERGIREPLGGTNYALMNITLNNTDKRFTPDFSNTIGTALVPNRPVKMQIGLEIDGIPYLMNIFKGLTDVIKEQKEVRTVDIAGYDYLSYLDKLEMDSELFVDQRSDEIIEQILIEAGFGSSQYQLDEGLNTIGYAWFEKTKTAGQRIRQICEAEEANFYQDEHGIIRFENRRHLVLYPYNATVWTINDEDIIEWHQDRSTQIINRCIVNGTPREAGDLTEIWKDGIVEEIPAGDSKTIWAMFENPAISIEDMVESSDYVANSARDGSGTNLSSNISIVLSKFAQTAKMVITNNSGFTAYLTTLRLRGTPAIVTSEILQIYEDADSINKYDEKVLQIDNDFLDDDSFAAYLAKTIVLKYKDPRKRIRIKVKGIPQIQLKDKVNVYDRDLGVNKLYRVMKIQGVFTLGGFEQTLTLREISGFEADNWAIVGTATVENNSEIVGI